MIYKRLLELSLHRGFFYPSFESYGGVAGFYDYGPIGVMIKNRIISLWRDLFIYREDAYEVDGAIVTPYEVLKASGHVDEFTDPLAECLSCKRKFRVDKYLEESFSFEWDGSITSIEHFIKENSVGCPFCGGELKVYFVNLMFNTQVGYDGAQGFLRPETAQSIFVSFPRLFVYKGNLPLVVGQVGRSFRNEISPRQGLVRLREFTQAELEVFFDPESEWEKWDMVKDKEIKIKLVGEEKPTYRKLSQLENRFRKVFLYFLYKQWRFFLDVGLDDKKMWFRELRKEERPHYSKGNVDLEVETSYGVIEVSGNADRGDYDLSRHEKFSGKNMKVRIGGREFTPHVFELSIGIDRLFYSILEHSYRNKGKEWEWFSFSPLISPYVAAVFPLVKKRLREKALDVFNMLKEKGVLVYYKESGSIGRRYARADEIGVPYAITIDHKTLEDETVTVRYRDSGRQERVKISLLVDFLREKISKKVVS